MASGGGGIPFGVIADVAGVDVAAEIELLCPELRHCCGADGYGKGIAIIRAC